MSKRGRLAFQKRRVFQKAPKEIVVQRFKHLKGTMMRFGKYRCELMQVVISKDPQYVLWLMKNIDLLIDDECTQLLDASLERQE